MEFFLFTTASRPALGPTQSYTQWVHAALSPRDIKWLGHEADHIHIGLRLRNHGTIPPFPQYIFIVWCLIKQKIQFHSMVLTYAPEEDVEKGN